MRLTLSLPYRRFVGLVEVAHATLHAALRRAGCRRWAAAVVGVLTLACVAAPPGAMAQSYPARTVTIVVPWPAGNAPDGIARIAATKLGNRLGQSFVVENRPGAGSTLGVASVAKADPDGHTLLVATAAVAINATLRRNTGYDPEKDLVPLAMVGRLRAELVHMMAEPDVQSWIVKGGLIPPRFQAPDELQRFLGSEIAHWRDVVSKVGLSGSQSGSQ